MPTGAVAFWRGEKGYGRIVGDDGEEFFVHFSGVATRNDRDVIEVLVEGERAAVTISDYVAADDDEDYPDDTVRRCAEDVRVT